jgi:branched-chain amino acid aminotransferase
MAVKSNYFPYAYINNKIVPFKDANVSIATNALQYGIGLFGGVKGYYNVEKGLNIFRLHDHIIRLNQSAKILRFKKQWDPKEMFSVFENLTKKNSPSTNTYFRPFIYRSDTGLGPNLTGDFDFALYMLPLGDYFDKSKGLNVTVSSWFRNSDNSIPPRTKASGGYINSAIATDTAKAAGYDAAILLDQNGQVTEGAVMNLYMVRDGKLITTGVDNDILEGITRRTILEIAKNEGIPVEQRSIDRSELYIADELFFSGTATEITWCEKVDGLTISKTKGPIASKLEEKFYDIVAGKDSNYSDLLNWIKY